MEVIYRSGRKPVSDFLLYLFYLLGLILLFVLINKIFQLQILGSAFYVTCFILLTSFIILYCFNKHVTSIRLHLTKKELALEYKRLFGKRKIIAIDFSSLDMIVEKKTKTIGLGEPQVVLSFFNNKQFVKDINVDDFDTDFTGDLIEMLKKQQVSVQFL